MNDRVDNQPFLNSLDGITQTRQQMATTLEKMARILTLAESEGEQGSGKLGLNREIEEVTQASNSLRHGVFRLVVLGDMKRGKSTFLNALIGENLLPSDVNPCTAVLTVLKYGSQKQVTVYLNNGKSPERVDLAHFKQHYTIAPEEAKQLETKQQQAFPQVSHVEIEYPLPLLKQGIEIVDTPGLNDTEARNQLVLNYVNNCHAVFFILSATQPCTLDERRYLNNYLKDRGLTLFFPINGWDRVRGGLVDPDDQKALQDAKDKLDRVFRSNLRDYCQKNGRDIYEERVFFISALDALRQRLKDPDATLKGTGFNAFLSVLDCFLSEERVTAQLQASATLARRVYYRVSEAIQRRIPLLSQEAGELKQRITSVQGEFEELGAIRDRVRTLIHDTRDREAQVIADSFKSHILTLEETFEEDFLASQPNLSFLDFLEKKNRQQFYTGFKRAFERYINDRLAAWEFIAKQDMARSFTELEAKTKEHKLAYAEVIEAMNEKLLGHRFYAVEHRYDPKKATAWADTLNEIFSGVPDSMNSAVRGFNMFWQTVLIYACVSVALQMVGLLFSTIALNIFGAMLAGMGLIALQTEYVRQQFIHTTRREFAKCLPKIADEQWQTIHRAVQKCFDTYEQQITERINADITSRKAQLDNLLAQKEAREIDREREIERLKTLETSIASEVGQIEGLV